MEDLIERGLDPNRTILVVIHGAKALRRAVLDTFGARALLQRCQAHKKRNVLESLPERLRASVRATMNQAYAGRDPKRAIGCWRISRISWNLPMRARRLPWGRGSTRP